MRFSHSIDIFPKWLFDRREGAYIFIQPPIWLSSISNSINLNGIAALLFALVYFIISLVPELDMYAMWIKLASGCKYKVFKLANPITNISNRKTTTNGHLKCP